MTISSVNMNSPDVVDNLQSPIFDTGQEGILNIIVTVSGAISILGSSFIIFSYLLYKEYKHFHLRLILYLSVSDFFTAATSLIGPQVRNTYYGSSYYYCYINAATVQFFFLCSVLWTGCIAHTVDQVIRKQNHKVEKFEKYYHLFCWGIPAAFDIYLGVTKSFGDAGLWCWIKADRSILRFICFYLPVSVVLVYNVVCYFLLSHTLNDERSRITRMTVDQDKEHAIQTTFRWFVLTLFICWIPAMVNRIQGSFDPNSPIFWLYCLHAALSPLQGFFNSIIYGLNDELLSNYKSTIARCHDCLFSVNRYRMLTIQAEDIDGKEEEKEEKAKQEQWLIHYQESLNEYGEISDD